MLEANLDRHRHLPNSEELPDSDDIPVDNEDQNLLPNILLFLLQSIWAERQDWYFGVDMGIYHTTGVHPRVPVVPDGFLSLGVARRKNGKSRRSYVTWAENDIVPMLALEVVSWSPGSEYDEKLEIYRNLGVLYYIIYNPEYWKRDGHQPFEVYKLASGQYQLQIGEPFWMPEVGLGVGRFRSPLLGGPDEGLCWFDSRGQRYLISAERAEIETQRAEIEAQRADREAERAQTAEREAERLRERLRQLGEDPDRI
jgi:Uma2 family endonuclease